MFTPSAAVVKAREGSVLPERSRAVLGWVALSVLAVVAVAPAIGGEPAYVGDGIDAYGTFWFYGWVVHCLETGSNPMFTDWLYHPDGKDVFAHTGGNIVDATISVPFQWIFGTPDFQPVFIACVLLANAWGFHRLAVGQGIRGWASWAGSALWMLNPFVMFEILTGRLTQAFWVFFPLAIHHFLRIDQGRRRDAVYAGVFTALQAWTYWFMGLFMAVAFLGIAAIQWFSSRRSPRFWCERWAIAACVCFLLIGPGVFAMADAVGSGAVPGVGSAEGWAG